MCRLWHAPIGPLPSSPCHPILQPVREGLLPSTTSSHNFVLNNSESPAWLPHLPGLLERQYAVYDWLELAALHHAQHLPHLIPVGTHRYHMVSRPQPQPAEHLAAARRAGGGGVQTGSFFVKRDVSGMERLGKGAMNGRGAGAQHN